MYRQKLNGREWWLPVAGFDIEVRNEKGRRLWLRIPPTPVLSTILRVNHIFQKP